MNAELMNNDNDNDNDSDEMMDLFLPFFILEFWSTCMAWDWEC